MKKSDGASGRRQLPDGYVSASEAARIIGCTPLTVRALVVSGHLRAERFGPRALGIYRLSAEQYAKQPRRRGPGRVIQDPAQEDITFG